MKELELLWLRIQASNAEPLVVCALLFVILVGVIISSYRRQAKEAEVLSGGPTKATLGALGRLYVLLLFVTWFSAAMLYANSESSQLDTITLLIFIAGTFVFGLALLLYVRRRLS